MKNTLVYGRVIAEECDEIIGYLGSSGDLVVLTTIALGLFKHVPDCDAVFDKSFTPVVVSGISVDREQLVHDEPESIA